MEVSCASVPGIWQISHYYPQMSFRFNSAGVDGVEIMETICFHFKNDTNASLRPTVNQNQHTRTYRVAVGTI